MFLRGKEGSFLRPDCLASPTPSGSSPVPWLHVVTTEGRILLDCLKACATESKTLLMYMVVISKGQLDS